MDSLYLMANDTIKMSIFSKIKTGNVVFDTILSTCILTCMSYLVKIVYETSFSNSFCFTTTGFYEKIAFCFCKKNTITLTGKKCSSINWNCHTTVNSIFGDSFNAVWENIISNIEKNETVYEIKDFLSITNSNNENSENTENTKNTNDIFIVSQKTPFVFNSELKIFAVVKIFSEETKNEKDKSASKIENIEITIYSFVSSLSQIKKCIDEITNSYLENIEKSRNNQKFIYTLMKTKYDEDKFSCWKESCFDSTRTFDNMFFEQKKSVLEKLVFFLNNRQWYYSKGIPYTIGFGLHGPPGTGKTSFIKSLANLTNRHIVVLSLKLLKTRTQLQNFFYEDRYNYNNKKKSIGFNNKIIVIEDIDAQCDIVLDRSKRKDFIPMIDFSKITEKTNVGEAIKTILDGEKVKDEKSILTAMTKSFDEEPITLDDILNLWDGIEETSGRMLVISSNHYYDLDPAITRPGRIDVSVEMNNASIEIIAQMYQHLYEKEIDIDSLQNIKPYFYSQAEIINVFLMYKEDEKAFLERLLQNTKVL